MLQNAKKIICLLLVLAMVFAMSATAFAVQEGPLTGGSITIKDAVPGQTYDAYQILYLESYNAATNAYAYKANSAWETWLKTQTKYVSFDAQGYVTWVAGADAAAFAKAAQAQAKTAAMTADATATAPAAVEGQDYSTVTLSNLKLGYYLVDTTLGTLCSLDTTNPDVEMFEKNEAPTNVKTVEEDSNPGNYGSANDADIGQTVNFKSTITAQAGAENYVFHDKMSNGLTFGSVTGITLNGETVNTSNYETKTAELGDDCTFHVVFTQAFCDTLEANDQIVISYTATVNANAVIGGEGNPNESKVEYGEENKTTTTPPDTTKTYTWSFDVLKYGNGVETNVLQDAQFVLLSSDKTKVATIVAGKLTGWTAVPTVEEGQEITWPENTVLTTDKDGKINIEGLDADTYYLRETKAPDGYNKLVDDVTVTITPTTSEDGKTMTLTPVTAKVNNQSGTELPSTGGMGTTIFYVAGSILLIGAAVLLITKKRMNATKE